MKYNHHSGFSREPVYRRSIYPWYDSEIACVVTILFLFMILLFGISGIYVALENYQYRSYVWVPSLITMLSGYVIVSNIIRLIKKIFRRFSEKVSRIELNDS